MINYIMSHPWLLALALPAIIASVPAALVKIERMALKQLFSRGDAVDQKFVRAVTKDAVLWAEEKIGDGPDKFSMVQSLLLRALPFLSKDQCKALIEDAVKAMDDEARAELGL